MRKFRGGQLPGVIEVQSYATLFVLIGLLGGCTGVVGGSPSGAPEGAAGTSSGGSPAVGGSSAVAGGGGISSVVAPSSRLVRLSRIQWENSVRDVLKLTDIRAIAEKIGGDALVGLDNEGDALRVGSQLRADYEQAAQALAERVVTDSAALARLSPADAPSDLAGKARALLVDVGLHAYRRPLTDAELADYQRLFDQGPTLYPGQDVFQAGARLFLQAILQSPHFLYRTELATEQQSNGWVALSDYEVAAKLALSLTASAPDAQLFAAAASGQLRQRAEVLSHAERLLATPAGAAARDHLHFQTYRLGAYDGIVRNPTSFPEFGARTPGAMREEVLRFLGYLFEQGKGVADVFTTPVGFVNDDLAPLYGLSPGYGADFKRVDLDATKRAGLLTLAGFLSSYAVVDDPDSIHRGVFVNQRVLCRSLPPPDPNATTLVPLDPTMTNRQRVEATTGPGTCGAGCHSTVINPPGFAFEHFDPIGRYRTMDRGKPIDASGTYDFSDGAKSFNGAVEFSQLLSQSKQAHACYVEGWMSYVNGRVPSTDDEPLKNELTAESLAGRLPLRDLVLRLVSSDGYLNRLP